MGRIIAVLAGQPIGVDYTKALMQVHDEMKTEGTKAGLGTLSPEGKHVRGRFPAYNCGTTMGMGSPRPVVMDPKSRKPLLAHLLGHNGVIRMARYQDCKCSLFFNFADLRFILQLLFRSGLRVYTRSMFAFATRFVLLFTCRRTSTTLASLLPLLSILEERSLRSSTGILSTGH